jgi:hypothetical protein
MTSNEPLQLVIASAVALMKKGDQAAGKANDFYKAAGIRIAECKERKPANVTWPEFCRQNFPFGEHRANELIQIGDGRATVEKQREDAKLRMRHRRSDERSSEPDQMLAAVKSAWTVQEQDQQSSLPAPWKSEITAEQHESARRSGFLACAEEALIDANYHDMSKGPADRGLINAAEKVVNAWSAVAQQMRGMLQTGPGDHTQGRPIIKPRRRTLDEQMAMTKAKQASELADRQARKAQRKAHNKAVPPAPAPVSAGHTTH